MPDVTRAILRSYGRPSGPRRAYLALRLRFGGYGAVLDELPDRGRVADLGAGDGLLAQLLVRRRPELEVLAVEADPARARRIEEGARGLPIRVVEGRMEEVALPPSDAVVLVDVLHYLPAAAQEAVLSRAAAALRPGGVLVLRDPDPGAGWRSSVTLLHERLFLAAGFTRGAWGRLRTGEEWIRLLSRLGLVGAARPLAPASPYADRIVVGRRP